MKLFRLPSFRQLSLSKQIAGTFSLIIMMMIGNYGLINYVERSYEKNFVHTRISKYNSIHFQESVFYLQSIVNGDDKHLDDLKTEIANIDHNLLLLKGGGEYDFGNRTVEVVPESDYESSLSEVILVWQNIRADIQEILASPELFRFADERRKDNTQLNEKFLRILDKEERLLRFNEQLSETYYRGFLEGRRRIHFVLTVLTVCLIGSTLFAYAFSRNSILNPIKILTRKVEKIAQGRAIKKSRNRTEDEIGRLLIAVNKLTVSLEEISRFASEVGRGNFKTDFELRSEEDPLGRALLEMRDNLREAAEVEQLNNLITKGTALFGELTGKQYESGEEFSFSVIKELVRFTGAVQGGFFALDTDETGREFLRLEASYAYGRRKYGEAKIYAGENLLGQMMVEQETLNLTDLPPNYTYVTTGLGEAVADHLLIVPLKSGGQLYGAVELAGFDVFDDHMTAFTEKISEMLASAVGEMSRGRQIGELLKKSQKDTEHLRSQEEQMRQNMEEIFATQDEMSRQATELKATRFSMEQVLDSDPNPLIIFDLNHKFIFANQRFFSGFGLFDTESAQNLQSIFPQPIAPALLMAVSGISQGESTEDETVFDLPGGKKGFRFSVAPLRNPDSEIDRFVIRFSEIETAETE